MRYHKITYPDVNNGRGCRATLWVSGCSHRCPNCHNPQTWDFKSGRIFTEEVKEQLFHVLSLPYIDGLTLSGGDPADSAEELISLLKEFHDIFPDKDVWLYTGYTIEEMQEKPSLKNLLDAGCNTVVDGRYDHSKRDTTLPFRGSSNQRIWVRKMDGSYRIMEDWEFDKPRHT